MGGFSDIGARHYFGQADFFMPELLLKNYEPKQDIILLKIFLSFDFLIINILLKKCENFPYTFFSSK